jgi:hypothetical protein
VLCLPAVPSAQLVQSWDSKAVNDTRHLRPQRITSRHVDDDDDVTLILASIRIA